MENMGKNLGEGVGEGIHGGLKAVGEGIRDIGSRSFAGSAGGSLSGGLSKGLIKAISGLQGGISGLSPGLQDGLGQGLKCAEETISLCIQGTGANVGRRWFDFALNTQMKRKKAETEAKLEVKRLEEALATRYCYWHGEVTIHRGAVRNLEKCYGF